MAATTLVAGWSAAAVLYLRAPPPDPEVEAELDDMFAGSKRYRREVERIGGKANLLAADLNDAVAAAVQGRGLAKTVAVVTALAAGGCALAARRSGGAGTEPEGERERTRSL